MPRFGWGLAAGFPAWRAPEFAARALRAGFAVAWLGGHRRIARGPVLLVPAM